MDNNLGTDFDGWAIIDVGRTQIMAETSGSSFPLGSRNQSSNAQRSLCITMCNELIPH